MFQMTISSGVYKYAANNIMFSNGKFLLFIMLEYLVWPVKSERARSRCVECALTQFAISVLHVLPVTLLASAQFTEAFGSKPRSLVSSHAYLHENN